MKTRTLFFCTAVLSIFLFRSCRELNENLPVITQGQQEQPDLGSFFGDPTDPPTDKPKDYDNWKPAAD